MNFENYKIHLKIVSHVLYKNNQINMYQLTYKTVISQIKTDIELTMFL